MPGRSGMEVLRVIAEKYPEWGAIVLTGMAEVAMAVEAMQLRARIFQLPMPSTPSPPTVPYRTGASAGAALHEISTGAGTQFDPDLVRLFNAHSDEVLRAVCP